MRRPRDARLDDRTCGQATRSRSVHLAQRRLAAARAVSTRRRTSARPATRPSVHGEPGPRQDGAAVRSWLRLRRLGVYAPVSQRGGRRPRGGRLTSRSRRALDERYTSGFGDLSVHEFATDPDVNVAYSSYYAGGMRVLHVRGGRDRAGRQVHRRGRQQLLGRRGRHDLPGGAAVRRLRPRLRPVPAAVHRAGRVPEAAGRGAAAGGRQAAVRPADPGRQAAGGQEALRARAGQLPGDGRRRLPRPADDRAPQRLARRSPRRWFAKNADTMSTVRLRIAQARVPPPGRAAAGSASTIKLMTRGIDGQLRHAEQEAHPARHQRR